MMLVKQEFYITIEAAQMSVKLWHEPTASYIAVNGSSAAWVLEKHQAQVQKYQELLDQQIHDSPLDVDK